MAALPMAEGQAAEWRVAPNGGELSRPSEAAARAADGDVVLIAPGTYYDCAVWGQSRLRLSATGPGVVLTDTTCQDKAIWVIRGDDVTVEGITFARARVPDANGAGIRAEGRGLTVSESRFENNEVGILGGPGGGTVRIGGSVFAGDGRGVRIGPVERLLIEGTRFEGTRAGEAVASLASLTVIDGGAVVDPAGGGRGCLITIDGDLAMRGTRLSKAAGGSRPDCVVLIGGAARRVSVTGSHLTAERPGAVVFVRNAAGAEVTMTGDTSEGDVTMQGGRTARMMAGSVMRAARAAAGGLRTTAHAVLNGLGVTR